MLGGNTSCTLAPSAVAQRNSKPLPRGLIVRSGLRQTAEENDAAAGDCVAALVYVYQHEAREIPKAEAAHAETIRKNPKLFMQRDKAR